MAGIPKQIQAILGDTIYARSAVQLYRQDPATNKWISYTHSGSTQGAGYPVGVVHSGYVGTIEGKEYDIIMLNKNGVFWVTPLLSGKFTTKDSKGAIVPVPATDGTSGKSAGNSDKNQDASNGKGGILPVGLGLWDASFLGDLLKKALPFAVIGLVAYVIYNESKKS